MTSQWALSSWKPGMFHESRQRRSYRDPSWRPRIQSDTESGLDSEGRWRDYSWLSSDNESEKWSWRQREISKVSHVRRETRMQQTGLTATGDLLQRLLRGNSCMTVFLPSSQHIQQPGWISKSSGTHQPLAVQQGCSALAACSPFGKSDHVVQLPHQRVDIFLLLLQIWVMVLRQSLTTNLSMSLCSLSTSYTCGCYPYLQMVQQNLTLPVDLHY